MLKFLQGIYNFRINFAEFKLDIKARLIYCSNVLINCRFMRNRLFNVFVWFAVVTVVMLACSAFAYADKKTDFSSSYFQIWTKKTMEYSNSSSKKFRRLPRENQLTAVPSFSNEIYINAYTTAYTYWDNTPPGSAVVSHPVIHKEAGGSGTFNDPITLAVGHSIINNQDILDYPAGTIFYIPNVRRYFIVEDTCGDGDSPQNGPCHTGYPAGTTTWVDMWLDGLSGTPSAVDECARKLTNENNESHVIIQNPASNYVVVPGPMFQNGSCTATYGNTPVVM